MCTFHLSPPIGPDADRLDLPFHGFYGIRACSSAHGRYQTAVCISPDARALSLRLNLQGNIYQMSSIYKMGGSKRIALVAHDNKKTELIEWAVYNKSVLSLHRLFATGTTGKLLEKALGLPITKFMSGPLGGDQQIGARIAERKIDVLIFFWDPMEAQPHDPDIKALLRLGVVWNIPFACDRSTADFLLTSPLMHQEYDVIQPDYSLYLKRPAR